MPNSPNPVLARTRTALLALSLVAGAAFADTHANVVAQMRDGKLREALALAERHLQKSPRDLRMRFLKGVAQQESGQHAGAIATYLRLAREQPGLAEPHHNLALVYLAQGRLDKARDAFDNAKRISRSHAVTYEKLGDVYEELARQTYAQVLRLDDADTPHSGAAPAPIRQLISLPTITGGTTLEPTRNPSARTTAPGQ